MAPTSKKKKTRVWNTPYFQHETLDVTFCLVVDDFGVRYGKQSDADHLIATLRANDYELTTKETGDTYLGTNISFGPGSASLSMPGYIDKALERFRPQYLLPTHRAAATPRKYHLKDSDPSTYSRPIALPLHHENTTPPFTPAFNSFRKITPHL
jgi:hypothetical protein